MKYTGIGLCAAVMLLLLANFSIVGNQLILFRITSILVSFIALGWIGVRYDRQKRLTDKDFLTNTYTRRFACQRFPQLSKKASPLFVYLLDLNNFKIINDQFGHDVGDQVLRQVAAILKKSTHEKTDIVARWGGDEFVVISQNAGDVEKFSKKLDAELKLFNHLAQLHVEFSIGKAVFPQEGKTLNELIKIADKNMYKEKASFHRNFARQES